MKRIDDLKHDVKDVSETVLADLDTRERIRTFVRETAEGNEERLEQLTDTAPTRLACSTVCRRPSAWGSGSPAENVWVCPERVGERACGGTGVLPIPAAQPSSAREAQDAVAVSLGMTSPRLDQADGRALLPIGRFLPERCWIRIVPISKW